MKQLILLFSSLFFVLSHNYGQDTIHVSKLPIDTSVGKVVFYKEIKLDRIVIRDTLKDIKQDEVFHRADYWFRTFFKNPRNVIQEKRAYDLIMGRHKVRLYNTDPKSGVKNVGAYLLYDVTITCKNGFYTYKISNMRKHQTNPEKIERWVDKTGNAFPAYEEWVHQLETYLHEVSTSVERTMAKSPNDN